MGHDCFKRTNREEPMAEISPKKVSSGMVDTEERGPLTSPHLTTTDTCLKELITGDTGR